MWALEEVKTDTREQTIRKWYEEVFPYAASYIQRKGGDLEAAKEVFQQAIVIYYEKQRNDEFQPERNDHSYLMGIVKMRWLVFRRKSMSFESLNYVEVNDAKEPKPLTKKLIAYLKQAGEKCMDLLQSYYYEKLTMEQLAERFGYASERSATVQKYKCLEKVRDEVKSKALSYEDFLE